MVYKYVCLGLLNPEKTGKVFWFHDGCALKLPITAGSNPEKTDEKPPKGIKCYECGKIMGEAS